MLVIKTLTAYFLTLAMAAILLADGDSHKHSGFLPDEVDKDEIIRRGEWIEQVGVAQSPVEQRYSIEAALAVPPDDSNKWYISVITTKGCKYCETLKNDFEHDATLQAWVNVGEPSKSWAHYQVYKYEDETQKPRFKKIRVKGFPTLLIQPPRNGEFGSSATVVWQKTGYDGNAEKLSREMSNAIKRYVAAINEDRQKNPKEFYNEAKESDSLLEPDESKKYSATPETEAVRSAGAVPVADTIGVNPPFFVPNKDEDDNVDRHIPPEVTGVLTLRELRELLPDADEEFIATQHKLGVTREIALAAWLAHKEHRLFSWDKIVHYAMIAVTILFVLFFLCGFLIVVFIITRFIFVKVSPQQPKVIHEKEVVHETQSPSGVISLSKEEYTRLVAASQQQNKSSSFQQSSQQSSDLIL